MEKEIKRIGIGYENCDIFYIDIKHIILILMDKITTGFSFTQGHPARYHKTAGDLYLVVHKNADGYTEMEGTDAVETAFPRTVRWNDVTDIKLEYADGTEEFIGVCYETTSDDLDAPNIHQTTHINGDGNLLLAVSTDKYQRSEFIHSWTSAPKEETP